MKVRMLISVLALLAAVPASAWLALSRFYPAATVQCRLGDVCDTVRFPLTPGTCSGLPGNPDWRAEITTAFARWNAATDLFDFTTNPGAGATTPGTCSSMDPNSVFFLANVCGTGAFGATTLAVARTTSFINGISTHSDIIFNSARVWGAYDGALMVGVDDFRRVGVHEAGHVMGLDHPPHMNAIMFFAVQDINGPQPDDLAGLAAIYGIIAVRTAPDINGNGVGEIVSIRSGSVDGAITGETRDGDTGALLRRSTFLTTDFRAFDALILPDQDGNGSPELAVLAIREGDGRIVAEIRNLSGAEMPRLVWFTAGFAPRRAAFLPDADGDGNDEIALLMTRTADGRVVVEMRNAFGLSADRQVWFDAFTFALDLVVLEDGDGNGIRELAVLLARFVDNRGQVQIKNAIGAPLRRNVWVMPGARPLRIVAVGDADGNSVPDVAMISTRNADGRIVAEVKNSNGATLPRTIWFAGGNRFEAAIAAGNGDANAAPDLAVMSRRADGRILLEVVNAAGAIGRRSVFFSAGFDATSAVQLAGDLDSNAVPEVIAMLSRQSDSRKLIQRRNLSSGAAVTRQHWLTP